MTDELDVLRRALERERRARLEAERLLEERSLALYESNQALQRLAASLEQRTAEAVAERTDLAVRLSALLEHLPVGVLMEDVQRRVVFANRELCALFAIPAPPEALRGADCAESARGIAPFVVGSEAFLARIHEVLRAGATVQADRVVMGDGRVLERDYVPVRSEHASFGHLWLYRDVTEPARAREELEQAKIAAERANASKASFLGILGHEMRNPLSATLGLLQIARGADEAERAQLVDRAIACARSVLRISEDILDFARLEAGSLRIERAPFDPSALAASLVDSLAPAAAAKRIALTLERDDVPAGVLGDEERLRQVLHNLVGNAIKLTERGSVRVQVDAPSPGTLRFRVRDTGPGIRPEDRARIFEPFEQLADGRRAGGSGLGLSIARALVVMMGGTLELESELGVGTEFRVVVPAEPTRVPDARRSSHGLPRPVRVGRVLLVDDDEDVRFVVSRILKEAGWRVTEVGSAAAALAQLGAEQFDVVVTDHSMPDGDGPHLARALRAEEARRGSGRARVVGVSASVTDEVRLACLAAGMDAFVPKPFSPGQLVRALTGSDVPAPPASLDPEVAARLPRYLERRRADAARARAALEAGDFEALARLGHDLRGHGASYGQPAISAIGDALEAAARAGDPGPVADVLTALEGFLDALAM